MTSGCRNIFEPGPLPDVMSPSPLATTLGLCVGLFSSLVIGFAIRGDLFRFLARLKRRRERGFVEFVLVSDVPPLE